MKLSIGIATVFIAAAPLLAAPPAKGPSSFTLSSPSGIPGTVLDPGSYTIRVVNRLSDRVILRIDGGNIHATFIGIPDLQIEKPSAAGPVRWAATSSAPGYLRGWYFAGMPSVLEFVYPKTTALAIASANPSPVPAIDPASEGRVTDNTLSQNDMQLLTLWLLSVEKVKSDDQAPAVKAVRYQTASAEQKPLVKALPHTASLMPVLWLMGLFSVIGAVSIRIVLRSKAGGNRAETGIF
jgi:hypothetical protein